MLDTVIKIGDDIHASGFELVFENTDQSFLVGYNRLKNAEPMFGWLRVVGTPVKSNY